MEEQFYYGQSKVAVNIKQLAILFIIIGIIVGIIFCFQNVAIGILIIIGCIVLTTLLYAVGEIIGLLRDIRENTEHLRDKLEEK